QFWTPATALGRAELWGDRVSLSASGSASSLMSLDTDLASPLLGPASERSVLDATNNQAIIPGQSTILPGVGGLELVDVGRSLDQ
ncbi:unnamed protein product, partial [Amoebophrya sp. A25]